MIPERTLPAGGAGGSGVAGSVVKLADNYAAAVPGGQIDTYDMQENRNGWPSGRPMDFGDGWRHGDIKDVAYLYVWRAWKKVVDDAELNPNAAANE